LDIRCSQLLRLIDEYTRECLAIDVAGSIRCARVVAILSQLVSMHGALCYLRSDNGPQFVSCAILKWAADNGMDMALSDPGKPLAERRGRKLQRQVPRRMPEFGMVQQSPGGESDDRTVAAPLQCHPSTFEPGLPDAQRVQAAVLFN
jgi:transposase InsO family protein